MSATRSIDSEAAELQLLGHFIGGADAHADAHDRFESYNPATGRPWALVANGTAADVEAAVTAAQGALAGPWGRLSPTRRGRLLMRYADAISANAARIAELETRDNGKLLREMTGQLSVVPDWFYYYGGLADKIEGRVIPLDRSSILNYTVREPLGVIGVITPWNSPSLLTTMAAAPALAAGNTLVLKPSEVTSASSIELARLALEAGIPPGVINVVTGGRATGSALVEHPGVAKVVFTGGVAGGKAVASATGGRLAQCLLELGGKSANIVFADANLDAAEAGVLAGIYAAGGQTCIAGSRAFVQQPIFEQLTERLARRAETIVLGDPTEPSTQMGPVATIDQLHRIEEYVDEARGLGAEIVAGGGRPGGASEQNGGFFYSPTLVTGIAPDSRPVQEEIFGPVLCVLPFDDEDEVVELANGTPYGLAAGVWTNQLKLAHRMARRLQAGTIWINVYRALSFNSPFGGFKASGFGRENGMEAVDEFLQTKSVWCELGDEIQDPFVLKV
jgi:acyl-CoA reductase-like NAD-dependent aldehyde dehydrogenase